MKKNAYLLSLCCLLFAWPFPCQGAVITSVVADGYWTEPSSWDLLRLPQAGDYIIIRAGSKITLRDGDIIDLCGDGNCTNSSHPTYLRIEAATSAGQMGGWLFFDATGGNPLLKFDELSGVLIEEYASIDTPKITENGDGRMNSNNNSINTFIEMAGLRAWGQNVNSCDKGTNYAGCIGGPIYGGPTSIGFTTFMPIRLLYFRVDQAEDTLVAAWATGQEKNNDYFSVEASWDGLNFQEVARLNSQGDAISVQYYTTALPATWVNQNGLYFRLKQTDHDGQYTYSHTVFVGTGERSTATSIYPNPIQAGTCYVPNPAFDIQRVAVFDLSGRKVLNIEHSIGVWRKEIQLQVDGLADGTYFVVIHKENKVDYQKIQIKN